LASAAVVMLIAAAVARAEDAPPLKAFRPCIDPNNLPFSNQRGEGYENRIAELFARRLGVPVESYAWPQRMNFVRNTIRYKLPDRDYPCDILMGVPVGFEQLSVTKPYYRSTYVLVFPQGKGLDEVKTGDDLFRLFKASDAKPAIGLYDRTPASAWLVKHGWEDHGRPYHMLNADPDDYPGEIIERELAQGKIDAAVVWGPIGAYFAKRSRTPLTVIPLRSEPGVKLDYEMAMGVRFGDREWKDTVERLIADNRSAIVEILRAYDVPLVDERGETIR
jgi:quinoprotein dehydrogenase-associated probable ABC transporter substrate-binding protein